MYSLAGTSIPVRFVVTFQIEQLLSNCWCWIQGSSLKWQVSVLGDPNTTKPLLCCLLAGWIPPKACAAATGGSPHLPPMVLPGMMRHGVHPCLIILGDGKQHFIPSLYRRILLGMFCSYRLCADVTASLLEDTLSGALCNNKNSRLVPHKGGSFDLLVVLDDTHGTHWDMGKWSMDTVFCFHVKEMSSFPRNQKILFHSPSPSLGIPDGRVGHERYGLYGPSFWLTIHLSHFLAQSGVALFCTSW
jgi:hypothetical protein